MVSSITDKILKAVPVRSTVRDLTSGVNLILPQFSKFTYDPGETLAEVSGATCQGVKNVIARYPSEYKGKVTLAVPRNLKTYALKRNRNLASVTGAPTIPIFQSNYQVPSTGLKAAATSGQYGFGVSADAPVVANSAYYLDDNSVEQPMTQGTYSTFDAAATPFGFAVGANFALKFGNSLFPGGIGRFTSFQLALPSVTYQTLASTTYSQLELCVALICLDSTVVNLRSTGVSVDTTGAIDFSTPDQEIAFFTPNEPTLEAIPLTNFC